MAHAYTPGLKVTSRTRIRKERRLPLKGQVVAKITGKVSADTIVARTQLPGDVEPLNIGGLLGVPPEDVESYLLKHSGDSLKKGEIIAQSKGLFGLFKTAVTSPVDGVLESISKITGQAILRHPPTRVEINAYIDGVVAEIFENEGVAVETTGAFVQGIFGIGGETNGILKRVAKDPSVVLTPDDITDDLKGKVIIGGSLVTYETLQKAVKCGCKGIVVGGISDKDLKDFLGYEIGVAITGSERKGITVVVTEGFGPMNMAQRTFELLCANEGKKVSINGATQIRAGVLRPEVIIPLEEEIGEIKEEVRLKGVEAGSKVRIIREPHFGEIGKVTALPSELQLIETGAKVRVLEVELTGGKRVILPRANIEMIEE
ncbi:hypothetical protein KAW65_06375 [candidate division WOR-3 bacterium]|nr:hypothetical protein [candidate division WOR-3 bacterium]